MARYFDDAADWPQVREVAVGDPVTGGQNGTVNRPLEALTRRTNELLSRVGNCPTRDDVDEAIEEIDLSPYAKIISPVFEGRPQAPTAPPETDDGQIATTAFVKAVAAALRPALCPPGTVISYAGGTPPDGFLPCDGRTVSRTQYAALFAAIGTAWGAGDGSTTFNLPNATGRFAEFAAAAGTYRNAGLPNITGKVIGGTLGGDAATGAFYPANPTGSSYWKGPAGPRYDVFMDASRSSSVYGNSDTVQPKSFTVLACIRY